MHSIETDIYKHRYEIVDKLKIIFPSMSISTICLVKDMEYFDITFNWSE